MPQYIRTSTFHTLTDTERMPAYVGLDGKTVQPGPMTYFDMGFLTPDLNGDGLADFVMSLSRGVQIDNTTRLGARFFLNDGKGGFTDITAQVSGATVPLRELAGYASGNLDRDALDELMFVGAGPRTTPTGEPIAYYDASPGGIVNRSGELPDLSATNASAAGVANGSRSVTGYDVTIGDLDADGDNDALVLTHGGPANMQPAFILVNDGSGRFTARGSDALTAFSRQHFGTSGPYNDWYRTALLDANGDGVLDIVVSIVSREPNGRSSFVALNDGRGNFSTARTIELPAPLFGKGNTDNRDVATGDLNGDGLADIVLSQTRIQPFLAGRGVQLLFNDGNGGFSDQSARITFTNPRPDGSQTYTDPKQIALFDFNHDGALDIIERGQNLNGNPAPVNFSVFLNDGKGNFTEMPRSQFADLTYRQDGIPAGIEPIWGDFNGDRITDFILTSASDDGATLTLSMSLYQGITPNAAAPQRTFTDLPAAQTFTGGTDVDTVVYGSSRADYTLTRTAGGATVAAKSGAQRTDTLVGIERVQFSDAKVALDVNGNAGMAYRLYQAAFDRTPDQGGLGYQMKALDDGLNIAQVAANFIASPEFQRTYGALNDTQFVTQLYQNVLHRAPDSGGLAFHVNNLATGANTRANVLVGFSESPENQAALIGAIQNGMVYTV